jgi:DnaJ family protein C protein 17
MCGSYYKLTNICSQARKFHELNQAYELLLDPLRRLALDAKLRKKKAREERFSAYDDKRKRLVEELEERERAFKKRRTAQAAADRDADRVKEEGRRLVEERARAVRLQEEEAERAATAAQADLEPPTIGALPAVARLLGNAHSVNCVGELDTTVMLKYPLAAHADLTTPAALGTFLAPFGSADVPSIVISMRPPKKAPHKPPKFVTAAVPFTRIGDAHAAVCAAGRADHGLGDVQVSWAGGAEPEIIAWLKKMGKLGSAGKQAPAHNAEAPSTLPRSTQPRPASEGGGPFSTFPSSFVRRQYTGDDHCLILVLNSSTHSQQLPFPHSVALPAWTMSR